MATSSTPVVGTTVKSFHFYHNMSFWQFELDNGTAVETCPAALGYSFAAGTTDGPGAFDFTQADSGSPDANPLWAVVSDLLRTPTPAQKACQEPKPILLDVGEMDTPYPWSPNIVDVQSLRVGQFIIIVSPSEATTMSGRRWRNAVQAEAAQTFLNTTTPIVVLGAPANTYAVSSVPRVILLVLTILTPVLSITALHQRSMASNATKAPPRSTGSGNSPRTST